MFKKCLAHDCENLVKAHKGTDKPLSGKGKLTEKQLILCRIIKGMRLEQIQITCMQ